MAGKKCIISVQGISKKFENFEAVKQVSLCINEGEIFGLLGFFAVFLLVAAKMFEKSE